MRRAAFSVVSGLGFGISLASAALCAASADFVHATAWGMSALVHALSGCIWLALVEQERT